MAFIETSLPAPVKMPAVYRKPSPLQVQELRRIIRKHFAPGTYAKIYATHRKKWYSVKLHDLVYAKGARPNHLVYEAWVSCRRELSNAGFTVRADWDGFNAEFKFYAFPKEVPQ